MYESEFPYDQFRNVAKDRKRIPWSPEQVNAVIANQFAVGRPDLDEHALDIWDAARYLILCEALGEAWLTDWKYRLKSKRHPRPDAIVPTLLFEYCRLAAELLVTSGVIRTEYVDRTLREVMARFPPSGEIRKWSKSWVDDIQAYAQYCEKFRELLPLFDLMNLLQGHLQANSSLKMPARSFVLGGRTNSQFPGKSLEVFVLYEPFDRSATAEEPEQHPRTPKGDGESEESKQKEAFDRLLFFIDANFKRGRRAALRAIAGRNGRMSLKDLAAIPEVNWFATYDKSFESLQSAANKKLQNIGWWLRRHDNHALLEQRPTEKQE